MRRESILAFAPAWEDRPLELHATLPSTNDRAMELVGLLGPARAHLAAVFAEEQTAGRGRQGRRWYGGAGRSLAVSVAVTRGVHQDGAGLLPLVAALALREAIAASSPLRPRLRWPNDLDGEAGKVAGILVEARWRGSQPEAFAVGAGANLRQGPGDFPEEIRGLASSVLAETGAVCSRSEVAGRFLSSLEARLDALAKGAASPVEEAAPLWAHAEGTPMLVSLGAEEVRGNFAGVGPGGELLLRVGRDLVPFLQGDVVRIRRVQAGGADGCPE